MFCYVWVNEQTKQTYLYLPNPTITNIFSSIDGFEFANFLASTQILDVCLPTVRK